VVDALATEFRRGTAYRGTVLGLYTSPGRGNGHAVTPYAVRYPRAGAAEILAYDNNFPNQERVIAVDLTANSFVYRTSTNPLEPQLDYLGNATTLTLNRIRGLRPHIGALLALDDETFTIWRAESAADAVAAGVAVVDGERLLVGLADGAIAISELQTAGKRPLITAEWLRGRRTPTTRATRPA
jgi:hypothetical protein